MIEKQIEVKIKIIDNKRGPEPYNLVVWVETSKILSTKVSSYTTKEARLEAIKKIIGDNLK